MLKIYPETEKPQACCDMESSRYALGGVLVKKNCDGAWLAATDGRCLTVTHAEVEEQDAIPVGGLVVSSKAWPTKKVKKTVRGDDRGFVEVNTPDGKWKNSDGKFGNDGICEGRFPRIGQVIPTFDGNTIVVVLDANLLLKISEAICWKDTPKGESGKLKLLMNLDAARTEDGKDVVDGEFSPVVSSPVGVIGSGPGIGLLMPCVGTEQQQVVEEFSSRQRRIVDDFENVVTESVVHHEANEESPDAQQSAK